MKATTFQDMSKKASKHSYVSKNYKSKWLQTVFDQPPCTSTPALRVHEVLDPFHTYCMMLSPILHLVCKLHILQGKKGKNIWVSTINECFIKVLYSVFLYILRTNNS